MEDDSLVIMDAEVRRTLSRLKRDRRGELRCARRTMGLLVFIVTTLVAGACEPGEEEKRQLVELRRIAAETSLYPGFQKIGEKVVFKQRLVFFFNTYAAETTFAEVKSYYDTTLQPRGWGPPEVSGPSLFRSTDANWVNYRKGVYVISVAQHQSVRNRFDVVYKWEP